MLLKIICSIFVLNIYVLKSAGESAVDDKKVPYSTVKYANETEIPVEIRDICSKVEQLQLDERVQQNRQSDLLNQLMGKVNELTMEQNSQRDLLNTVLDMLNELREEFIKVASLESNIDICKAEQIRQGNLLEEQMSKIKESTTELISQRTLLNAMVMLEVNGSTTDRIMQSDLLHDLTCLDPIKIPSSCAEVAAVSNSSGIHQILVPSLSKLPFCVSCDMMTLGGGWTTVLVRKDGSVDFFRKWEEYKRGIGTLDGEYFIGLEKLHHLTKNGEQELLIQMGAFDGRQAYAKYDQFVIASEEKNYEMTKLGKYSGDAGDDLRYHKGKMFSSWDRDNDGYDVNWVAGGTETVIKAI